MLFSRTVYGPVLNTRWHSDLVSATICLWVCPIRWKGWWIMTFHKPTLIWFKIKKLKVYYYETELYSWTQWNLLVISVFKMLKQENSKSEDTSSYIQQDCVSNKQNKNETQPNHIVLLDHVCIKILLDKGGYHKMTKVFNREKETRMST